VIFFTIKTVKNGNSCCRYCFVAADILVSDLSLKPWLGEACLEYFFIMIKMFIYQAPLSLPWNGLHCGWIRNGFSPLIFFSIVTPQTLNTSNTSIDGWDVAIEKNKENPVPFWLLGWSYLTHAYVYICADWSSFI
jgi:hypothetical protein